MINEEEVTARREPMDQLADEFLGRYRQGERPSITDYVQAHPDLAEEIRELFPTLVVLERLGPRQEEFADRQPGADWTGKIPQNLGEYRIIREVGRGGMGVVYEAEQLPLGRRVALKVLPSSAVLNPSVLTRFQNEVRAAARLHHTNIVPVFGVGEDQGTHYYAMQFIAGQGLDIVLAELRRLRLSKPASCEVPNNQSQPTKPPQTSAASAQVVQGNSTSHGASLSEYFQSVARMGLHVAEALVHAHSQGVLHRDIKPSNLLLDAQGNVWVTDFGLAKQAGCDVTNTGDVVGTLRYLAPERLRGTSDARTDIYGLGVTLYELLTTQPAFPATDRARLVHDIVHTDPAPPRRLERRLPRDLETIVLKAMAKDPAERYAAAVDMAADLRRFLDDKPIGARRLSPGERLWRWCVRRPALASLAAALFVSLAVGVTGVCWQWARAETHLQEAIKQQTAAETMLGVAQAQHQRAEHNLVEAGRQESIAKREAVRAEGNFQTARRSVNELLTLVSEEDLMDLPGLQPVRLNLLTKALEFHEQMLADRDHDPAARRDLALAYLRLGILKGQMGPAGEQVQAYRRAIELLESPDAQDDRESVVLRVKVYNSLAIQEVEENCIADGQAILAIAREQIDRVLAETPDDLSAQVASAMTFNNLAYSISESPDLPYASRKEDSIAIHERALDIYRRAAAKLPDELFLQVHIANTLGNIARRYTSLRRIDQARQHLQECLAIRQEIARRRPTSLGAQFFVAAAHNALGDVVLSDRSDRSGESVALAAADYGRALAIQERMARENPVVLTYRQKLAETLENLARLHHQGGALPEALDWRRRETAARKDCLDLEPTSAAFRANWAKSLEALATLESDCGLNADSLATRMRVRETWQHIPIDQRPPYRAQIKTNLSRLMIELGMQDRPGELLDVACECRELLDGSAQQHLELASDLHQAALAATRGATLDLEGQDAIAQCQQLAVASFREAARIAPDDATQFATDQAHLRRFTALVRLDSQLAQTPHNPPQLRQRGHTLQLIGETIGAKADLDHALALLDAALRDSPSDRQALRDRAVVHFDTGRFEQVIGDSTQALAQRRNDATMLALRGRASLRLGQWQQAHDDLKRSLELAPQRHDLWPHVWRANYELGRVEQAQADAAGFLERNGDEVRPIDSAVWGLLADRQVARFPDAAVALARRLCELADQSTYRRPLGGVYFQLGRYQEVVNSMALDENDKSGETAAFAAFWLAMSYHHLGQEEQARQMFALGVRNWKAAPAVTPGREEFLRSTWHEAKSLLFGSEPSAARS